jgi:MFS family permease
MAGRLVSQFADGLFQAYLVARIVFLDPEGQGTAIGVAKAYAILVIPFSVIGPVAGVLIDRWSRRRILAWTPLLKALAILALLAINGEGPGLYALALIPISLNRFYLTTATASIPAVVPGEDLLMANSMSIVGGTIVSFVGIVVGTKLVKPFGLGILLGITAAGYPISAFLATRIRARLRPARLPSELAPLREDLSRVGRELLTGARRLAATPAAAGPIAAISFDQFLVGLVTVLSLVVFKQRFGQGVGSYGNIIAAGGVGVFAGTLSVGWFETRLRKPAIVAWSFVATAVVSLAVAPAIVGWTILVESFVLGLTFAWRKIPVDTMVQQAVPDRFRGRVFAVYDLTYASARVVAAAIAVPLIPRLSTGWILALVGVAYLLVAPVVPRSVRRTRYVRIRFAEGGRAEETPRAVVVAGEEEPVTLVRSTVEEGATDPARRRRFVLEGADGMRLEVSAADGDRRWRLDGETAPEG